MNADDYIKHWKKNNVASHLVWPKHQKRFKTIASYCQGVSAIDVRCAFGDSTFFLNTYYRVHWTGIDFSESAIKEACLKYPKMYWRYYPNLKSLIIDHQRFDTVVCSEVIEHVDIDFEFVEDLWRITEKILIITTPKRTVNDPGHLRLYNMDSLDALFLGFPHEIISDEAFYYIICRKN